MTREARLRRAISSVKLIMFAVSLSNGIAWIAVKLLDGAFVWTILGLALAGVVSYNLLRVDRGGKKWTIQIIGFFALVIGGSLTIVSGKAVPAYLSTLQALWTVSFPLVAITLPLLTSQLPRAATRDREDSRKQALHETISANRRRELEHAEQIQRQRNWIQRASRDGFHTGFEPRALESVEIARTDNMYGNPGDGLSGSGFNKKAVQLGQEGEINFAKALSKTGLIHQFATFWSVHMPDDTIGASDLFQTDIDCVIVTHESVWLVDVKNFAQGDVTWKRETRTDGDGTSGDYLVAIDNLKNGYVGKPRKMTRNMELATQQFSRRFANSALKFQVKPVVVLMPRDEGIGVLQGVTWPNNIPAVPLQQLLDWLNEEPQFSGYGEDEQVITMLLRALIKDKSGSAPRLGNIAPMHIEPTNPSAPSVTNKEVDINQTIRASSDSLERSRTEDTPQEQENNTDSAREVLCVECNETIESDWKFCYHCGSSL